MQRVTLAFGDRRRTKVLIAPPWANVGDRIRVTVARIPHGADPGRARGLVSEDVEEWEIIGTEMIEGDVVIQQRPGHA
jgi:hypothetical protein